MVHEVQPGMINKRTLKDQTALLLAVARERQECVACLLEVGADPDIANKDKETPLYKGTAGVPEPPAFSNTLRAVTGTGNAVDSGGFQYRS